MYLSDMVVTHQALIREWVNGMVMVLFLNATAMIGVFMWDTMLEYAGQQSVRDWSHAPGVPTACALWWVFAAETYRAGAVWSLYQEGKFGGSIGSFFAPVGYSTSFGYLFSGLMLIGGLQRCIFIFTPPAWKRRVWLYATAGAVAFCSTPALVPLLERIFPNGF